MDMNAVNKWIVRDYGSHYGLANDHTGAFRDGDWETHKEAQEEADRRNGASKTGGPAWPSHFTNKDEKTICNRLISRAFKHGYWICVINYDGGDTEQSYTTDRKLIQKATAATCGTIYRIGKPQPDGLFDRLGNVLVIHGNGCDNPSDFGARTEDKLAEIEKLFEGIGG